MSGEIIDEFCEHFLRGRARLGFGFGLLFVVLVVLCQPVMPNGRFGTVYVDAFSHVGSVVEMGRIRGAVAVPGWGLPLWCGLWGVGGHCLLSFGWPLNCEAHFLAWKMAKAQTARSLIMPPMKV